MVRGVKSVRVEVSAHPIQLPCMTNRLPPGQDTLTFRAPSTYRWTEPWLTSQMQWIDALHMCTAQMHCSAFFLLAGDPPACKIAPPACTDMCRSSRRLLISSQRFVWGECGARPGTPTFIT